MIWAIGLAVIAGGAVPFLLLVVLLGVKALIKALIHHARTAS